ncbi:MAG: hypothetical protein Q9162_002411 [Coniocarpon cinnabarinum]
MSEDASKQDSKQDTHFCVFIHGLWGNPGHLTQLSKSLLAKFSGSNLHVLIAKRNVGNFTYDGIELGAERVTKEIEDEFDNLEKEGKNITKISVVGYSLGGLIARYAIGLLYSKGYFDRFEPINFSTFAAPHLGVRTPLLGWSNQLFNVLGSRTLSVSGQQLWATDDFQGTGRPILAILADPNSVFMRALSSFKHRLLYANIINDRAVPFYTACIEDTDPFVDLDAIKINYVPGWENVLLEHPYGDPPHTQKMATKKIDDPTWYENTVNIMRNTLNKAPFYFFLATFGPIGMTVFFTNAGIQSFRSANRISEHEEGKDGIEKGRYKIQLMLEQAHEQAQKQADKVMEGLTPKMQEQYLPDSQQTSKSQNELSKMMDGAIFSRESQDQSDRTRKEELNGIMVTQASKSPELTPNGSAPTPHIPTPAMPTATLSIADDDGLAYGEDHSEATNNSHDSTSKTSPSSSSSSGRKLSEATSSLKSNLSLDKTSTSSPQTATPKAFPTLALTPDQFAMKASLDAVGWRKYPVHIKRAGHSHAAIIVRMQRPGFGEGRIVAKHWVERFEI